MDHLDPVHRGFETTRLKAIIDSTRGPWHTSEFPGNIRGKVAKDLEFFAQPQQQDMSR